MNAILRNAVFTVSSSLAIVACVALSAEAGKPHALLIPPGHHHDCLPEFGFSSFNIHGVGERVTSVRRFGLASRLGLEPGDMILSMNGFRLNYDGAWNDALYRAVANGGWVNLTIRDMRTGRLASRQTFVGDRGPVGPITPKVHVSGYPSPVHHYDHHMGPVTPKSKPGRPHRDRPSDLEKTIKTIARLID